MKIKNIVTKITSISEKNKMLILFLVLLSGWFYWFQYRPTVIRRECNEKAEGGAVRLYRQLLEDAPGELTVQEKVEINAGTYLRPHKEQKYDDCLHEKGLK